MYSNINISRLLEVLNIVSGSLFVLVEPNWWDPQYSDYENQLIKILTQFQNESRYFRKDKVDIIMYVNRCEADYFFRSNDIFWTIFNSDRGFSTNVISFQHLKN